MTVLVIFLLLLAVNVESLSCPSGQAPCGMIGCYDPTIQGCTNNSFTIQCINSCNDICYSNSQYCYNNTKVCNNSELVCDLKTNNSFPALPLGLTCYNSSDFICSNNMLCYQRSMCGTRCLNDSDSVCANDNQTICYNFSIGPSYSYEQNYVGVCGSENKCYDSRTSLCLGGTTVCEGLNASLCGGNCLNPDIHICVNNTIQCIHSCNGTCYLDSQYCVNNAKVCENDEIVCDVKTNSSFTPLSLGLMCYDPNEFICSDNTLCAKRYACDMKCLNDSNSVCANDQRTVCHVLQNGGDLLSAQGNISVCGPQQQCYDTRTSVCLGGLLVCDGLNARFCGGKCFNPNTQACIAGNVRCINSCNGTCYSNSNYCYNNTKICNNDQLVCDVQINNSLSNFPLGLTCYNSSDFICVSNTLCYQGYLCGTQCLNHSNSVCANDNQTICHGFSIWSPHWHGPNYVSVCGPKKQCYDSRTSVCLNNSTVCPIGNQLCSDSCYDPQLQDCIGVNYTIYCISDPLSSNCPTSTFSTTMTTIGSTRFTTTSSSVENCSNSNLSKSFVYIVLITFSLINKFCF